MTFLFNMITGLVKYIHEYGDLHGISKFPRFFILLRVFFILSRLLFFLPRVLFSYTTSFLLFIIFFYHFLNSLQKVTFFQLPAICII